MRSRSNRLVTSTLEVGLLRPKMPEMMMDRSKDMGHGNRKTTQYLGYVYNRPCLPCREQKKLSGLCSQQCAAATGDRLPHWNNA